MEKDEEIKLWQDKAQAVLDSYNELKKAFIKLGTASGRLIIAGRIDPKGKAVADFTRELEEAMDLADASQKKLVELKERK